MASITSIDHVGIGSVLNTQNLRVPIYQRPFSWEVEQVHELLNDVQSAIEGGDDEYFLGSIVLTTEADKKRPSVVDGQQRLVAISMIYAAIRDYFEQSGDRANRDRAGQLESRYLLTHDLRTQEIEPKLRLSAFNADFFEKHVLGRPGTSAREQANPKSHSNKLIAQAYRDVRNHIADLAVSSKRNPVDTLIGWAEYVTDHVKVIAVKVSTEANAFQIFETLNDRGLDLSIADLLKNYVFKQAGDEKLDTVQSNWQSAMIRIGGDAGPQTVTTFIRHFWASKHGLTRERQLYQRLKENIRTSKAAVDFTSELAEAANHYAAILSSDHEFWAPLGSATRRNVSTLLMLRMEQCRPLLLACMDTWTSQDVDRVVRLLISWSVRFRITHRLGSSSLENFYGSTGKLVRDGSLTNVAALLKYALDTVPGDQEFEAAFANAEVEQSSLARYYLRAIEHTLAHEKGSPEHEVIADEKQVNLEHVLPLKAKTKDWPAFDAETSYVYSQRLGNIALLRSSQNFKLGNKSFAEKRKIFEQSGLGTTKSISKLTAWTPDTIAERQKLLARVAVRTWSNKP